MAGETFLDQLTEIGALKHGHFLLASGKHSAQYVEKFDLLRNPRATEVACRDLIEKLGDLADVELVVGPTTGGILLAFEIGRQLGLPAAYADALERIEGLILSLLPRYRAEGKSYVTIAFGCTGGRHRSVHVAERVAARLRDAGFSPTVAHRDLQTAPQDSLEGPPVAR